MIKIPDSVFQKNTDGETICAKCKKPILNCECPSFKPHAPNPEQYTPSIRLDKTGRKGKTVTVIENLPQDREYLKELARLIKSKTGSGGTFFVKESLGVIEIQGDHRVMIMEVLRSKKFEAIDS